MKKQPPLMIKKIEIMDGFIELTGNIYSDVTGKLPLK